MQLTTTMTKKIETKSRRRTPWTGVSEATPMQIFIETCTRDDYEGKHPEIKGSAEIPLLNSMSVEECRQCGSGHIKKRGFTANGLQRYKCLDCGCSFNILTNTLFDCHKIPLTEWLDFLLDIFGYGSFSLTSKANRNSINTTKYWIEKVFLMLEDYQKDIVLGGKVWIDETFYRVREPDVQRRPDGKEYRGLSRNQQCIAIGTDGTNIFAFVEGTGKTSSKRTWDAFSSHIKEESHLIHDMEKSHGILVSRLNLTSEVHDSRVTKNLADKDNPMDPVNQACRMLKLFLRSHSGFMREDLQDYLNLFCFIMNPPENKYEKLEKLLNLAVHYPKVHRFRG